MMIGSLLYQLLPLAVLPIITRLLPPDAVGAYFTWLGGALILNVVMSLRLDMAIFQARDSEHAKDLLRGVVISGLGISLCLSAGLLFLNESGFIEQRTGLSSLFLWSIIVAGYALAVNVTVASCYARDAKFKRQAIWRIVLGSLIAVMQLSSSLFGFGAIGLVAAHLFAVIIVTIFMVREVGVGFISFFQFEVLVRAVFAVKEFRRFPLVSMPSALINTLSAYLPLFILTARMGPQPAAHYGLTQKALSAPLGLIGGSITAVFREESSREYREKKSCKVSYKRTLKALVLMGALPFGALFMWGEQLFPLVFGAEWAQAGVLAQIMAPLFFARFVASPLSYMFFLNNEQFKDLFWQVALLAGVIGAFVLAETLVEAVFVYSSIGTALYLLNIILSYRIAVR